MNLSLDLSTLLGLLLVLLFWAGGILLWLRMRKSEQLLDSVGRQMLEIRQGSERLERWLAEEQFRAREESESRARALREELGNNVRGTQDTLLRTLAEISGLQKEQLDSMTSQVGRQLENVHKSVGEMQSLAAGVGDLKRVLTNVKARGTWGEIQLGNLLEQVLTADQLQANVEVRPGSGQRVEFAVRLPGTGDREAGVLLPIDSKFPQEDYDRLVDASERGDKESVELFSKALEARIRASAREISEKYIQPPYSTDFGILFLPTEGLFAEVIRRPGLAEAMQREFRVVPAGPTTLTALLNSLQMGFRILAIERRSSEVWRVLAAVKTEFAKYGEALNRVHRKLHEAGDALEAVHVRRRAIERRLKGVEAATEDESGRLLGLADIPEEE